MTIKKIRWGMTTIVFVEDEEGEPVTLTAHRNEQDVERVVNAYKAIITRYDGKEPAVICTTVE